MRQLKFSVVIYIRGFASFDESTTSTTSASSNVYVKVHLDKTFDATNAMKILKAKKVLVAPFDGQRIFDIVILLTN